MIAPDTATPCLFPSWFGLLLRRRYMKIIRTIGAYFISSSYESLFSAVNQYNRKKIREFASR